MLRVEWIGVALNPDERWLGIGDCLNDQALDKILADKTFLFYNSLSEALIGFSLSISFPSAFSSPPYHPRAPNLSGKMGCEK